MAFCDFHWFSGVIGKQVGTYVILPDPGIGKPPYPVFYLLHGLSDDHTIWHRRTRIEWFVRDLPLIVVMPDGFRGFYTNTEDGVRYADYIGQELPDMIERTFPAKRTGAARCIGGLSMGGYGALRLALGFPGRFVSATSNSGALMRGTKRATKDANIDIDWKRLFGARPEGSDHDLIALARKAAAAKALPRIRIDCGTEDFLLEDNRTFHAHLESLRIPHEYEEFPGGHTWDYWDQHVRTALDFHAKALRIRRP